MAKKAKNDKCKTKGCRRKVIANGMCTKCSADAAPEAAEEAKFPDPLDAARRLTQVELLKLGKIGAELENAMLQVRLSKYELADVKQAAEQQLREQIQQMEQERQARLAKMQRARRQYDDLTSKLSEKYGVKDPKKMIVDTETGLIREADSI